MNISSCRSRIRAQLAVLAATWCLTGCYVLQSASGHLVLMRERQPISRVLAAPATPQRVRLQLESVADIRRFSVSALGLPDNGSYKSYADTGRQYVVWNVFAAPEFSVQPKLWCYPFVGCVAYKGYFKERRALAYAAKLERRGYDVATGGVAAYSTLGHFDDPILNTMLDWSDVELAAIVFHELTHQALYVPSDADFNESLATVVEEEGVRRWLQAHDRLPQMREFTARRQRFAAATAVLLDGRTRLEVLYARRDLPPAQMRSEKHALLQELTSRYRALTQAWGGRGPFDAWFAAGINNAHLVSVATYYRCVPGWQREMAAVGGDMQALFARARNLARQPRAVRRAVLCQA